MSLFAILLALALDQAKPLPVVRINAWLRAYGHFLESRFNAGERHHGLAAWMIGVAAPVALVLVAQRLLDTFASPLFSLALGLGVLYLTMGFRQFSHFFTDIHLALRMGEIDRARHLLATWRGGSTEHLSSNEVARLAIEEALVATHRQVFAPLFCFVVAGPAGALLYRLALFSRCQWGAPREVEFGDFGDFARQAFTVIDWLPMRATAAAFAVVGDFEGALYCWRNQAQRWQDADIGILLASGAGALGVVLGLPLRAGGTMEERPELGLGDGADVDFMQSTVGLMWRTVLVFLFLLALFWIASWVGN